MCHDRYAPQIGNVRRQHKNARTAYYADDKDDEHVPTQFEIEHRSPLFDYLSAPSAPFRRVVAISSTLATVSGRLHRGPKVVSSRAELIHHNVRCGTSKQKRPPESGHGVEISVIPQRSVPWTEEMSLLGTFETSQPALKMSAYRGRPEVAGARSK
jgi:hypothetical protein